MNRGDRLNPALISSSLREKRLYGSRQELLLRKDPKTSKDKRKSLTLLNVRHQDRPKTRDAGSARAADAGIHNSCRAGFQKLSSECLRRDIAGWRETICVRRRSSNVVEFGTKIRSIIDVICYFFFVPICFLQPELLVVSNFRL